MMNELQFSIELQLCHIILQNEQEPRNFLEGVFHLKNTTFKPVL